MAKQDLRTEEKIKEAARKLFLEKGFGSATTRDIARCADTNIALVNYYFQTKENLFQEVFQESFTETFLPVARILNDDLPLEAKIYRFVDHMIELVKNNPLMPLFVLSETRGEHSQMCRAMLESGTLEASRFQQQLDEEAARGHIRPADARHIESSLVSMVLFPFLSMNILKMKYGMDDEGFRQFVDERKKIVPEMVLGYLRGGKAKEEE